MTDMDRFINAWNAEYNEAMARHFRSRLEGDLHRATVSPAKARAIHDVLLDMERHGLHDELVWTPPPESRRCTARRKDGAPCSRYRTNGHRYCYAHRNYEEAA